MILFSPLILLLPFLKKTQQFKPRIERINSDGVDWQDIKEFLNPDLRKIFFCSGFGLILVCIIVYAIFTARTGPTPTRLILPDFLAYLLFGPVTFLGEFLGGSILYLLFAPLYWYLLSCFLVWAWNRLKIRT